MIRKSDVQWWLLEAKKHPESAPQLVQELAERLAELDAENERLRDEIIRMERGTLASTASDEVNALRDKVAALQSLLASETPTEPAAVLFSDWLQSARLPLAQAQRLAREERPVLNRQAMIGLRHLLLARPQGELLLLTSQGRALKMQLSAIPPLVSGDNWPAAEGPELAEGERVTAALAVAEPPRFWTVVTRRGFVRQLLRIDLDIKLTKGEQLIESSLRNDEPVALVDGDRGDLLLLTRWGKGVRFPHRAIAAEGSAALEMEPDDEIAAALSLPSDSAILIVTAAGFGMRRDTAQFAARSRPGGAGKTLIQAFDVLGAFPCQPQAQLLYLTHSGKLVFVPLASIPLHQRSGKGSRVRVFDRDPAVAVTLVPGDS